MREEEIDTPALVIDLDAFESNLDTMAALLAPTGAKLRAHAKTHKSPVIAKLQMARGAVGNCVQKVAEAEVLAWGGIPDILVSNEVVGAAKLARLCALSRIAKVAVCADDAGQVAAIEAAAADAGIRMTVLVEIDVGAGRCGVQPGPDAVALATRIAASKHLIFGGLQAYHGSAQHKRTPAERRTLIGGAVDASRRTVEQLRQQGLDCPIVGGAGTGTFEIESASGIYNEIQAGSYVFMDADYARNLDEAGAPVSTFRHALFVLSTVMSAGADRASRCWMPGTRRWRWIPACRRSGSGRTFVTSARRTSTASWISVRDVSAEVGREATAGAGPLRSDGRPVRLVCRGAQRPGGVPVAGRGARRNALT